MRRRAFLAGIVVTPLLPACTTAKKAYHQATQDLRGAVLRYHEALRNGDVEVMTSFIAPPDRPAFLERVSKLSKEIRWTEVRIGAIDFPQNASEATVTLTRTFYRLNELTEREETQNQVWLWKAKELRWLLKWTGTP